MTHNEMALFQAMQEHGFSTGYCTVTLSLLSGNSEAVTQMLLLLTDKTRMSESRFIEELALTCREFNIEMPGER